MVPCKTCPIRVASAFLSLQIKTLLRLQIAKRLVSQKSVRCHDVQTCQKLKAPRRSGAHNCNRMYLIVITPLLWLNHKSPYIRNRHLYNSLVRSWLSWGIIRALQKKTIISMCVGKKKYDQKIKKITETQTDRLIK